MHLIRLQPASKPAPLTYSGVTLTADACLVVPTAMVPDFAGPYPFLGANLLKLFADAQVFVVALVGLVLRKDSQTLSQEGAYDREFYGNVMLALLLATLVPAVATLFYKSPVERVLISMQEIAMELPVPQSAAPQGASPATSSAASPDSDPESSAAARPPAAETDAAILGLDDSATTVTIDLEASATPVVAPAASAEPEPETETELQLQPHKAGGPKPGHPTEAANDDDEAPKGAGTLTSDTDASDEQPGGHNDAGLNDVPESVSDGRAATASAVEEGTPPQPTEPEPELEP
jgi:hypothetical protein